MAQQARDYTKGIFLPAYDLNGGTLYGYIMQPTVAASDGNPQAILPTGTAPWRQKFAGACQMQDFVGGTGTAAGESITLKLQGAGILVLDANQSCTVGDELIASAGTLGTVKSRTGFSGSCYVVGIAQETLSSSTSTQRVEAYINPMKVENRASVSVSQPLKTTTIGALTAYGSGLGLAFSAAAVGLYVARFAGETIANLGIQAAAAPGGADTVIATIYTSTDDGNTWAARATTCTMTGAAKSASDLANQYVLAAGEIVALQFVSSGALAAGVSASFDVI